MPSREQYIAQRVGARMAERGEPMVLRRVSKLSGPVPYINPPDVSGNPRVVTAATVNGQAYLGVQASSIIGRLVAGDQVLCAASLGGAVVTSWVVVPVPTNVATDSDGVITVDNLGAPSIGTPTLYFPDALAAGDRWLAIPVTAAGNPDPTASIGSYVSFSFTADTKVNGVPMSLQRMAQYGWTEVDSVGVTLAAYNHGPIAPPAIDDLIIIGGQVRAIMAVGQVYRRGVQFLYPLQAK